MSANAVRSQRRTAYVYGGAAVLIVVVGVKTVLKTMGIEGDWMSFITLAALGLEFFLLLLYAMTIYQDAEELRGPVAEAATPQGSSGVEVQKFTELQEQMNEAIGEIKATKDSMALQAERLDQINQNLEQITDANVRQKVKDELQHILSSVITPS